MNDSDEATPIDTVRPLLRVKDAAKLLGLGQTTLYKLMDAGRLAYVRFGASRRIELAALTALIDRSRIGVAL